MSGSKPVTVAIPVVEEALVVEKTDVETGRVRIALSTETVEDVIRETLRGRRAVIDRVAVSREVTQAPQVREENGVVIVPVVEEILVVEKRLFLKEELHIRYEDTAERTEMTVERRVQSANIERIAQEER